MLLPKGCTSWEGIHRQRKRKLSVSSQHLQLSTPSLYVIVLQLILRRRAR